MPVSDQPPAAFVPAEEVEARLARFQARLAQAELPLALVTHPIDLYYLTGAMPDAWLVAPAAGRPILLVRKSLTRAREESSAVETRPFPGTGEAAALLRELLGPGWRRIGADLDVLPAATYLKLASLLPQAAWVDSGPLVREVRAIKSPWEIERHRRAARQHVATFDAIKASLRDGMTELELSAIVEAAMRRQGHQGLTRLRRPGMELWFANVVAGPSAAQPTAFDGPVGGRGVHPASGSVPGLRRIARGATVMADIVSNCEGYNGDIARAFCIGEPSDEVKRAHDFCIEALRRLERLMVPGALCSEIFREVDAWAKAAGEPVGFMGYGDNRVKFFGHGIGLEVDEYPIIAKGFAQPLQPGMVVAVEPKAFHPELGPAGLEMSYVITESSAEALLEYPEEIAVL
jgi:Xaa-Pro aminopeptidase